MADGATASGPGAGTGAGAPTAQATTAVGPGRDLGQIAVAVLLGVAVAVAGASGGRSVGGLGVHIWVALLAFAVNWAVFAPSFAAKTEHYYDLTGSLTYLATTLLALIVGHPTDGRSWLLTILIFIWALRLGTYLFSRVRQTGGDRRFDRIKQSPTRFLMTWTLQGLWVVFTAAAAHAAIASETRRGLGLFAVVGLAVWVVGFGIEVIADAQKSAFRKQVGNNGKFITSGLWAWSRHPNYFGEIVLWVGIAMIAMPVLRGWQLVTLTSPVFVFLLLTRISGLPMLERRADKRWGGQDGYEAYKSATPILIPRPPRR